MAEKTILGIVIAICALFAVLSVVDVEFPPPSDWLLGWTTWAATIAGTLAVVRVFWIGGTAIRNRWR